MQKDLGIFYITIYIKIMTNSDIQNAENAKYICDM